MKKIIASFVFLFAFVVSSNACLNYYYTLDKEGDLHFIGKELLPSFNVNFSNEFQVSKMKKLEAKLEKEQSYMLLSDYAVSLLKIGKNKEALEILVELNGNYPGEYKIASNLGTAYELNEEVDSALKYIKRGLELNPNDHEESEWIHVKILETKKNLANDSSWLQSHTVLGLSEMQKQDTVVAKQILIQLQERFPFSPGPDAIMASMFVDLGDIYANTQSIEYAKVFYQIAREYYGDMSIALSNKIRAMQKLSDSYSSVKPPRKVEGHPKASNEKPGTISYKTMLKDSYDDKYKIDWNKLTYDPKVLLAMVNLNMSVKEAREQALKNPSGDLKFVADSTNVKLVEVAATGRKLPFKSNSIVIILFSILGVAVVGLIAYKVVKSRRSK